MKKRVLSILLALMMLITLLPVSAYADAAEPEDSAPAQSMEAEADNVPAQEPDTDADKAQEDDPLDAEAQPDAGEADAEGEGPADREEPTVPEDETPAEPEMPDDEEDREPEPEDAVDEEEEADEQQPEAELHSRTVVNPLYVQVVSAEDIPQADITAEECINGLERSVTPAAAPLNTSGRRQLRAAAAASNPVYTDSASAGSTALKAALLARESEVRIYFRSDAMQSWDVLCDEIYAAAIVHTGSPVEGDYLRYENGGYNASGTGPTTLDGGEGYYYVFAYSPLYYTTAEQEESLNAVAASVLSQLNLEGRSDYDKVSAIYGYLTKNVSYDEKNLDDDAYLLKYTAYAALIQKTAVCQGYAAAFYRLCLAAGIDTRIISSAAMNHAWNIARVGGSYYALDATWDAGQTKYSYFLKGSTSWLRNHGPVSTLGDQFASAAFKSAYPLSAADFTTTLYRITYNLNGGVNSPANPDTYSTGSGTITLAAPTKDGYRFDGWFSDAGLTQPVTEIPAGSTGNRSLYAGWTAYSTVIRFDPNGGTGVMENMSIASGERKSLPANTFSLAGHSFAGWNTKADGSGSAFRDTGAVKIVARKENTSITLYAQWTPISYTIAFNANGGKGTMAPITCGYQQQVSLPSNSFDFDGHEFTGWNTMADGSGVAYPDGATLQDLTASVTLYAQWTGATYAVQYELNGGINAASNPGGYDIDTAAVVLAAPTRTGYSFVGWFKEPSFKTRVNKIAGGATGNLTLYAKWNANIYTVSFDANGGTGSATRLSCVYDSAKALSANRFKRTGYTFIGWSTEPDGSVIYADKATVVNLSAEAKGTVVLYAQWTPSSYTVAFDTNGGSGSMSELACTYGQSFALPTVQFTRKGYSFKGWTLNARGSGTLYADGEDVMNLTAVSGGSVTLYAQWTPFTYAIQFQPNGGTGTMVHEAMVQGKAKALTANSFRRTGYTFAGWNTRADGSGSSFSNRQRVTVTTSRDGATVYLFAQWTPNNYTVSFAPNGGSGSVAALNLSYDAAGVLPSGGFTRTGYTFAGWNTKANGTGTAYAAGASVMNLSSAARGRLTLYAQWTPNRCTLRFDPNGGVGSMEAMTLLYGQAQRLTANAFTRTGYSFYGWNTRADGTGTAFTNRRSIKSVSAADGASITLYAQWKANRYTVRFNANGGRGSMGSLSCFYGTAYTLAANRFTRAGYTFVAWNTSADGSGESFSDLASVQNLSAAAGSSVILYAQWRAQ